MRLNIEKTAILKTSEFFNKIPEEALFDLAEKSSTILLKSGETVIFAKTIPDTLFVVLSGKIEVYTDSGNTKTLGKNDTIGFFETIEAKETSFFAVATEETEVIKINKSDLLLEIASNPELALGIIYALCYKINNA